MKTSPGRAIGIARTPNIQIYEGLTELLGLIRLSGFTLELVCPPARSAEDCCWSEQGVIFHHVAESSGSLRIPVTAKLLMATIWLAARRRPALFVGSDVWGNILAALAAVLFRRPFLYYGLELPSRQGPTATCAVRLEHWSIRRADLIVTMDRHHAEFISEQTGVDIGKCVYLPVARSGRVTLSSSDLLRKRFGLGSEDVIVLHAGGVGAAQQSIELAESVRGWPANYHLVFHAHCRMEHEPYFQRFQSTIREIPNVHLNSEPVPPEQLDELVASADVGLAWYDRDLLGYRADLLGLAPGKVGRSLRNGVPVVVRDLFSIREYVEKYECGICAASLDELPDAIRRISERRQFYEANALRCFEELWRPENYFPAIQQRIQMLFPKNRPHGL